MAVINEKKKTKPIGKKKIFLKFIISALSGIVFAGFAAGTFVYLEPMLKQKLEEEKNQIIVIGQEQEDTQEEVADKKEDVPVTVVDVQDWQYSLYDMGSRMSSAMVMLGENGEGCGAIVALHENQVIILAIDCNEYAFNQLYFLGGTTVKAKILGHDKVLNMAVVSVPKMEFPESVRREIKAMEIGSSKTLRQGQYVIAIGRASDEFGTVATGIIRKGSDTLIEVDRGCILFQTDIMKTDKTSGFLVDEEGLLVGVITHQDVQNETVVYGIGISNIIEIVDHMANQRQLPYLGIEGVTVTRQMHTDYNLPWGVYVEKAMPDSPALKGNICAGDVIAEIDGYKISSMMDFQNVLMKSQVGQKVKIVAYRQMNGELVKIEKYAVIGTQNVEMDGR